MRSLGIAVGILAAAVALAALDEDAGLGAWLRLRGDLGVAQARVAKLHQRIGAREAAALRLRDDPLALEQAIRADLGWARPGDLVVILDDGTTGRNP